MHTFDSALGRQENLCESKASLLYIVSSRLHGETVSLKEKKKKARWLFSTDSPC